LNDSTSRAEEYRLRAEELRATAERWPESFAREGLMEIARKYEALAASVKAWRAPAAGPATGDDQVN
jgi:hypothetical protein